MDITQLLSFAMQNNASDLHLSAGNQPIIRVDGELKRVKGDILDGDTIQNMLYSVMSEKQRSHFEQHKDIDFAISFGEKARFRVNGFRNRGGTGAVFRVIPHVIPTLEDLDLPPIFEHFCGLEKGLVLLTGPTGSGKSTTLAAMINHINEHKKKHIITIEDPVEFMHESKKSLINHRELGVDTDSFANALRASLREDPDVILVGEMRDYETIHLALTAAETGHLVFATLHANSAPKTIDRIIDVFPPQEKEMIRAMLASSLQGVVSQTLLKRASGEGRIAAFEILVGTNAVRNLIRENKIPQIVSMLQTGSRFGMITMSEAVNDLAEHNLISEEEAKRGLLAALDLDSESVDHFDALSEKALTRGTDEDNKDQEGYAF